MKQILLVFVFTNVFIINIHAQAVPDLSRYKTNRDKLEALADLCDSLAAHEEVEREKVVSKYALKIAPANDWYYRSIFYYNLGFAFESSDPDSSIYFHEKSLADARKGKLSVRILISLQRLLYSYSNTAGHTHKSEGALKEMLASIDTTKNERDKASLYATIGNYYFVKGQYNTQINYLLKGIAIKKKLIRDGVIKDREDVAVDLLSLSELYIDMAQGEKGLYYGKEARNYIVAHKPYLNHYYKDMADVYILLKQPGNAKIYYDSLAGMITPDNQSAGRRTNKIASDLTFADFYLSANKLDSAAIFIKRANDLAPKWANEFLMSQVDFMTGTLYMGQKKYAKALPVLKAAEPNSAALGLEIHAALLQSLAKCYAANGQWQQAFAYYDKYAPIRDSLYLESSRKSIADAEAQYQNKDKQQQIEVKNIQIDKTKKQLIWLISGLLLLALSLVLLGVIYRNKRKNAEILDRKNKELAKLIAELEEANSTKAKLFSIISHDLRSPISQVYQFLKLQQLNPKLLSEVQKAELSEKIQTATGSLLETMEDLLLWSKTQMNQFQADIQPVDVSLVALQSLKLLQLNVDAKNLQIENNIPAQTIVKTDPNYLQAIVRNLLQNAVKASEENGSIRLGMSRESNQLTLFIENEGKAFSQADYLEILSQKDAGKGLSGLGLRLVDDLSVKTGLKIRFENPGGMITRSLIVFT
ncbi:HAMP domain-containing histidine kinase [Dyadobacter chenwenxiniae]|uniref:histidine kinase n=1 Tax=Dyadobacter chenwenxiniae TaxID=2906456 RepID=A0A9X1PKQ0_9BACT|nr:HAMP domain-containing sensor histidine kinase [Dyadobacter chenwenxiniae]MCF0062850.1 HAMP domain-containing histidine kinase [Dyadobacter chenwenxiniae]UON84975.1 HAMP domain-containing histidine kinase [Dyadobacter chenwenxiniae]